MTAINLAVADDRVLIVCDEAVSVGAADSGEVTTKALALPALRCVIAVAGHIDALGALAGALLGGMPAGTTVADLVAELPALLRRMRDARGWTAPTSVFLAGVSGDGVEVYELEWPTFDPLRMPAGGVYMKPPLRADTAAAKSTGEARQRGEPFEPSAAKLPAVPWSARASFATAIMLEQHREQVAVIGGRRQMTLLTPDTVTQTWLDPLPAIEA
jgi:hypothetical protein